MKKLLIATSNPSKEKIYAENLTPHFDLVFLRDLKNPIIFPPENEPTVEANALLKAKTAFESSGIASLGDDAGVAIDALGGAPGVMARRWNGLLADETSDEDWIEFFMEKTKHVPDHLRTGKFQIARTYYDGKKSLTQNFEIPFTYEREVRRPYLPRWAMSAFLRCEGVHWLDFKNDPLANGKHLHMAELIELLTRK